ncbi:hypothetical protein mRhiFer1_009691 [Rhinolophus ferrumequinum]|uniref:Uncharacterized protein n=1 Tax=Rhinolophus ferrumequinum TaxID=59479 RepID=A0A7J7R0W3_RHIFE|nr:hypothetical protein mRhiFer1_009691 [Rhinolophus ferrumequinum]
MAAGGLRPRDADPPMGGGAAFAEMLPRALLRCRGLLSLSHPPPMSSWWLKAADRWCVCGMAAPGEAAGGSLRAIPTQAQAAAVGLLGSRAGSPLGVCTGRRQGPDGHLVRVHLGSTAQVALVAAPQPASALAALAKVSISSLPLSSLTLCGPGQGPVGTEMGVRSRTSCLRLLELLHRAPARSYLENQGCTPEGGSGLAGWPGWALYKARLVQAGLGP